MSTREKDVVTATLASVAPDHSATVPAMDTAAYQEVLGSLMQGVAVFDARARLRFFNPKFVELMVFPEGFARLGMGFGEIVAHNHGRGVVNHGAPDVTLDRLAERVLTRGGAFRAEIELPGGDVLALRHVPLADGGFVNTYTPITSRSQAEAKARASLELLQAIIDNMADGIRVYDADLKLIAFNARAFEFFDYPPELTKLGVSYEDIARFSERRGDYVDDDSTTRERIARARNATGRSSEQALPDGRVIQKRRNAMPDGGFVSTYSDITALKQAQDALADKARELEVAMEDLRRSNTELEQFAYVASHDLQEPLRMVGSYCQLLARRYADKLDDDAREFIAFAVDGAGRMQRLINDLLLYSRVGTRGKEPQAVALDDMLDRALANLKMAIEDADGRVTHDPLPTIMGDDVQMIQLFQNLIGNALKFHRDVPPEVHVGTREEAGRWLVSVSDNGIGMEPAYFERIFLIFQRLNKRGEYPGTGIGLAICKKIVERHGGQITVESEPGRGSTFTFSLPKHGETP